MRPGKCWIWMGARNPESGYGRFSYGGKLEYAHRFSYEFIGGKGPPGNQVVMHKCDNPPCVNPEHLTLGSYQDNMLDMKAKGRAYYRKGTIHGMAKLDESKVMAIVAMRRAGTTFSQIGSHFGVNEATCRLICNGKRWSHVTGIKYEKRVH